MVASCVAMVAIFASGLASAESVDDESVSLLQTAAHLQSAVHSDRDTPTCKAATKALRATKKQWKTDRAAAKAARAALKMAKEALSASQEAHEGALAALTVACPAPEPDRSPDVGCSTELVTSVNGTGRSLFRGSTGHLPTGPGWYGFQKVTPGDGLTPPGGKKLGVGVMQPCSQAWTGGTFLSSPNIDWATGKFVGAMARLGNAFMEKKGVKTACECREWAETVMPWPTGAVVDFKGVWGGNWYSGETRCRVWKMFTEEELPWRFGGFSLVLNGGDWSHLHCYLGNPEEWADRVKKAKAEIAPKIIDKCSKDYWASGNIFGNEPYPHEAGKLVYPDPLWNTVEGRKMCLKWVKQDPKCANAVGIQLHGSAVAGACECYHTVARHQVEGTGFRVEGDKPSRAVCLL